MKTQLDTKKPPHLDITLKPKTWIDPEKFIKQIADAGYAARKEDIRLTLTGKITKEGEKLFFTLEDVNPDPKKFLLKQSTSKDDKEAKAWADAFEEVSRRVGETFELEGFWRPVDTKKGKEALSTLSVIQFKPIKTEESLTK